MAAGMGFRSSESHVAPLPSSGDVKPWFSLLLSTPPANLEQMLYAGPVLVALGGTSVLPGLGEAWTARRERAAGQVWLRKVMGLCSPAESGAGEAKAFSGGGGTELEAWVRFQRLRGASQVGEQPEQKP